MSNGCDMFGHVRLEKVAVMLHVYGIGILSRVQ